MGEVLYNVNEDSTTVPVSYYPSVVVTGNLNTDDISKLISEKQPTITADTARACLNEFREVCIDWLSWGVWVLIEDFVQIYTDLDIDFGQDYIGDIQPEDLLSLGDAQHKFEEDTESLITFTLNRYTFPTKPYINSVQEKRYNYIGHIVGNYGCYLYGEDFGASMDDPETGVWLESPAGNNYQQNNNISFSQGTIIFIPEVTGEQGPGGANSVEHILTVRGRYVENDPVVIGHEKLTRAINFITESNAKLFLSGNQTECASIVSHDFEPETVLLVQYDGNVISVINTDGEVIGSEDVDSNGDYIIRCSDNFIALRIDSLANLGQNSTSYGGAITELINLSSDLRAFISEWDTEAVTPLNDTITLPWVNPGIDVDWGDGVIDQSNTHTYDVPGVYFVIIWNDVTGFRFNNSGDKDLIVSIHSWGTFLVDDDAIFYGCSNLTFPATDVPSITTNSFSNMFRYAPLANPDVSNWDVSSVTNMYSMFMGAISANPDVSNRDVSSVTNMRSMLNDSAFSDANYDLLLVAWDSLSSLQSNVMFHAGDAQYGQGEPSAARASIISKYNWSITDGGQR